MITVDEKVLHQALDVLELYVNDTDAGFNAITALKAALEQPERRLTEEEILKVADEHPVEGFDPEMIAFARAIVRAAAEIGRQT